MNDEELIAKFGQRVQRCYGCFVAFHMKDMSLGEGGSYYCAHCRDDTMFHFDEFSRVLDLTQLPSMQPDEDGHHHHH